MTEILFVTGTDTGVGKTVACAWLAARAAAEGRRVVYVKPVQTGIEPDGENGDAAFVARTAGVPAIELLRFRAPLAPSIAAELEGDKIDFGDLVERTRAAGDGSDLLVVEGAGGLLVPITPDREMADLAAALDAELVVVARPALGTLNHTALTLEAAQRRRLRVSTIAISGWPAEPEVTETTNYEQLSRHGVPIVLLPAFDGLDVEAKKPGSFDASAAARA